MELVAIYNEARTTQNTHRRGEPLPRGWYMVIAAVWVVNKRGELLLTLRSPEKKEYPNTWENPGGAVLAGETSKQGMVRELREETGITAEESQLEFLVSRRTESSFVDTYLLFWQGEEVTLQPGETAAAKWVTLKQLEQAAKAGELAKPIAKDFALALPKLKQRLASITGAESLPRANL